MPSLLYGKAHLRHNAAKKRSQRYRAQLPFGCESSKTDLVCRRPAMARHKIVIADCVTGAGGSC
jgi:hypothetical protein